MATASLPTTVTIPPAENVKEPITNSLGMRLVYIPPGEFLMGNGETAESMADFHKTNYHAFNLTPERFAQEYPQHRVRITRPFYMGAYHVTRGQFRKFVDETGYKTVVEGRDGRPPGALGVDAKSLSYGFLKDVSWRNPGYEQSDEHPVVMMTWSDAVAFCEWLSKKEGKVYRLPTEAEWEYACRAGTTTRYHCGDNPESLATVANVGDATLNEKFPHHGGTLKARDGYFLTSSVGKFQPNSFGLYDMHGNARQWCWDWYKPDYYLESPVDDPTGPGRGYLVREARVLRGGSWLSIPWECYSASRHWANPTSIDCDQAGFRVVSFLDPDDDPIKRSSALRPPAAANMQVSLDKVQSTRPGEREAVIIHYRLSGPELADVLAIRTHILEATDDNDRPLEKTEKDEFKHPRRREIWLNAPGSIKKLKLLRGYLELMLSAKDPSSNVTANFPKEAGVPLKRDILQPGVIEITLQKLHDPKDATTPPRVWKLEYLIKDPYGKVIGNPEFLDRDGRALPTQGPWGGGSGGTKQMTIVFFAKPPDDLLVRFHIATENSLVSVPFEFKDISVVQPAR
ncbi:MAG: formylglycine-generating enzyme family protein [Pirellulales bacterium]|nr:formylglycine-generating enzyme family protein [Pirellulales bacterium]